MELTNDRGHTLSDGDVWRLTEGRKATRLYWEYIPKNWWGFWRAVLLSFFRQNRTALVRNVFMAAIKFHAWLDEDALLSPDDLSPNDYGRFHEWMKSQTAVVRKGPKAHTLHKPISEETQRATLVNLKAAWREAGLLGLTSASRAAETAIGSALKGRFRNIQDKAMVKRETTTLTSAETDRIYSAVRAELQVARAILDGETPEYVGYERVDYRGVNPLLLHATYDYVKGNAVNGTLVCSIKEDLCRHLGVSDSTVRDALGVLEGQGLIVWTKGTNSAVAPAIRLVGGPRDCVAAFHSVSGRETGSRPFRRVADLMAILAIWLSIDSGVRPGELHNIRLSDIREDLSGHGNHSLICRQPNKPEDTVPLDDNTMHLLRDAIRWSARPRQLCRTDYLFVDWVMKQKTGYSLEPSALSSDALARAINRLFDRHRLRRDTGHPLTISLYDFRHTFGAHLAALGTNKEKLRRMLRHDSYQNTEAYYMGQALVQLSHNVSDALQLEARRLALAYRTPVNDIEVELPEVARAVEQEPEREFELGICMVDKTTEFLKDSCIRAQTCLTCPYLVPELRKRSAYEQERDLYLQFALAATDERIKQQRLRHAALAQGYVQLCDEVQARQNRGPGQNRMVGRRKMSYGKPGSV